LVLAHYIPSNLEPTYTGTQTIHQEFVSADILGAVYSGKCVINRGKDWDDSEVWILKELGYWEAYGTLNRALLIAKCKLEDRIKELRKSSDELNHLLADQEQRALDDINFIRDNDIVAEIMKGYPRDIFKAKQSPNGV
jgi:hypothetical protein